MNAAPQTDQQLADEALEEEIEHARRMGLGGPSPEARRLAFALMAELVHCRSPEQIERISRARGLPR
jgi:hypothetical protein